MSNLISRISVNTEDEKKILITSITDTNFLKAIQPIMKEEFFHLPLSRKIWSWITTFYEKHKQAPGRHIQDIFQVERAKLESVDQDLIELMLLNLSDQYEEQHNTQYLIDNAEVYLRGRAIDVHIEKIKSLRTLGHIDEAEQEIAHFNRTSLVTSEAIAINPHDPEFIRKAFETVEKNNLFKLPGALGELLGILCRNWLIICQAAYKRGKTWNFQILRNAAILNRLRVIDCNHEMSEEELAMRHWKGVTGLGDIAGNYEIPVFDCLLNQTGQCNKSFRKNDVTLFNPEDDESKPSFKRSPKGYKTCDHCRKVPELRQYYVQEVWKTTVTREGLSPEKVIKRVNALNKMVGDRVRFKSFPRGTANVNKDTRRTLEMLADQGWIADVVLDDYGDIHAPEDARRAKNDEIKLNDTTLAQAGLASEWHLLYCTASQINKAALKHKSGKMGDASGSARAAYAHPAFVYSINQTEQEEEMDAKRINIVARRFGKKSAMKEVLFLQALELGQALLDSEWIEKNG